MLSCKVVTNTRPDVVQWLVDSRTLEYSTRFRSSQVYNGSALTTTLTVSSLVEQDYATYNCTVQTAFG